MSIIIEIKHNNCITNDPCAICGERCDPTGIDPFIAGTWELVCDDCAAAAAETAASREYWGVCPACGHEGRAGDVQAGYACDCSWCRDCELLWRAGAWRDETRDQQRENYADTFPRPVDEAPRAA